MEPIAEHIELEPVESSSIAYLGYNEHKQIAAVSFKSGDIYHYAGVPLGLFAEWCQALSIGHFYVEHIKGKFTGQRMTGACPDCGAKGWIGERCTDCGCSDYREVSSRRGSTNGRTADSVRGEAARREDDRGVRAGHLDD
jgi:hypothetical protein